ncbi:MAG TPA: fibronectin type III domain-containing protein, partial [Nakamurella sp.]|nr:fibronectin type III domain-containing protein [Nakamurella sp.]
PDGTITIADSGAGHPRKRTVDFVVSDGVNSAQGTLTVDVVADTDLVPVPSPVYATGVPGRPVTVHPLDSVLSLSADPLRLAAVSPAPGVTGIDIDADAAAGSVVVTARRPGHYYLSFQVVSGSQTADGVIRVDIADPSDDRAPVPVTDIAYLPQGGDVRVDLTGNDAVLGGGVLAVQQIDVDQDSGLTVTLADLHVATISAHRELDPSGVWFSYTVSAGASPATGWVHVVPVPARSGQAPVAGPMSVTVRAGDAVTVPAGSAARDFGGSALTVQPFDPLPAGSGLLFAAGQDIRYLAPSGGLGQGVRTTYTVQNTEGRTASAPLQIRVVPQGVNHPPRAPTTTTARAFTGQTVSIALPLDGIDPDGDWVVATAIATAPEGGRAEVAGPNTITFTASDTPGPVSFDYTVADPSGATATGTVLVGVVDRPDLLLPPVAPDLTVTVPPGGTLAVDVLSSVTDPSGLPVDFADPGLTGAGGTAVVGRITDDRVVITAGDKPGVLPLTYTVQNSGGLTASGVITVRVSPDAPPVPPTAHDAYVTPDMVSADRRTARVDVSGLVANPGGAPDDWHLEVPEVDGRAVSLAGSRSLRVVLTGGRQVLAYRVRNTAGLTASAFIVVPGRSDLIPDNTLPGPPTVPPSSPPNVAPSTANGPTSRTSSPTTSAPTRSTTQVSLPAPTMDSARVSVQAGGSTTVQLDKLVRHHARYPQLRFTGPAGAGNGIAATLQGNRLRVSAGIGAEVGATAELTVTVSDGVHPPVQGHVDVVVARTTAPLPTVPDATVQAASGKSSTVNMLSGASNPLSDRGPLRVTDARVTSGDATVGADPGGSVTVTPAGTEFGTVTVLVTVTDPANRTVSATLTVTVLGPPGAPGTPSIAAVGDRSVTLTWPASDDHGSAVRHYVVHGQGVDFDCLQRTTCPVTGLINGRTYTFTVTASNDIGTSAPSAASAPATPDVAPEAPAAPRVTAGDRQLGVSWDKPENHGSPIASYRVTISPKPVSGAAAVSTPNRNYTFRGLANGTAYTVTVAARNSTGSYGPESAPSDPATPAAPPSAPPAPQVDFSQADGANSIDVSWARPAHDGGDPALRYTVHWSGSEDAGSGRIDAGTARTATIPDVRLGATYTVWVVAVNKAGASPESARATVTPVTAPERVAGLTAAPTGTGGQVALQWAEPASGGRDITGYQYRYRAGDTWTAWTPTGATATSATVTDLANGTRFEFSVRACNAASSCGPGSATAAANPYAPPAAIADLSAYGTGTSGEVKVAWTAPAGNGRAIAGYQYRYKSTGDYTAWTDSPQGTATSFSLQGFTNGTNYTFQVRALTAAEPGDAGGRTHLSDPSNTDVAKPCTVPSTMKAPTGSATGTTSIKLRWSAPFDGGRAIDTYQYRVYRGSTVERGWTDAGSGSSHTVTDLKAGTNYRFQVRACNSVGCGGPSAKSSAVKTDPPPPAAQLVHGASVSNSQCNVNCYYFKVNYQNLRSGSYTVTLYLDGSAWRHYTWSLGGDGSHQATSYAGKNAGRNARVVLKGPSGTVDTGWRAWP